MNLRSRRLAFAAVFLALIVPAARAGILEDRAIRHAIDDAYVFRHVLIDRGMVQIYVRSGEVELRGQVSDESERALIVSTISAIPHVKQVNNLLFVDSAGKRDTDRWRALRLRAQLLARLDLDATATKIARNDAGWEITGTVGDERQRQLIVDLTRSGTPGQALGVNLEVVTPTHAPIAAIDDPSVTAMVRNAVATISGLEFLPRGVVSLSGEVTLHGTAASADEIAAATQAASAVRGVRTVSNQLTPRS